MILPSLPGGAAIAPQVVHGDRATVATQADPHALDLDAGLPLGPRAAGARLGRLPVELVHQRPSTTPRPMRIAVDAARSTTAPATMARTTRSRLTGRPRIRARLAGRCR